MIKHENGHLLMSQAGATSGNDYVSAYEGYMFFALEGNDRFIHAAGKLDSALTEQEYQQVTEHFIETVELSGVTNFWCH